MQAVTWQGRRSVAVRDVPDPQLIERDDAIISVTSAAICGSDLHLYEVLGPFMRSGDILGHETMGIVEEIGPEVKTLLPGDRVVVPFNIACGSCYMCQRGLQSQCEITQVQDHGTGAKIFGYSELYGSVPGGQAERLRVPFADYGPVKVGTDHPDDRYLYLSDILPTAWQAVAYAELAPRSSVAVIGLGPVGQLVARVAIHLGHSVIAVDPVSERREVAAAHGAQVVDLGRNTVEEILDRTNGRGADASIDAVGMEAHGPVIKLGFRAVGMLPAAAGRKLMKTAGVDAMGGLSLALQAVRRGGTVSLAGVYGGNADPLPMLTMFDRQLRLRMGQCNVRRWIGDLMPIVEDPSDPLDLERLATDHLPLQEAADAYQRFQQKRDGCLKIILHP